MTNWMSTLVQLRQRKLVQWGLAYLGGAWLVLQVVDLLADRWSWAAALGRPLDVLLLVGFVVALVLAWFHGERGRQTIGGIELLMLAVLFGIAGVGVRAVSLPVDPARDQGAAVETERGIHPRSVAVLPFLNVSSDPEQEYFSDGLTLELIGVLGQVPGLLVHGSSSSFAFKGTKASPAEIASKLKVATLVGGSVRRSRDRLRIDAELVEAATGLQIWSDTFDEPLTDQFELQERIAREIAGAFRIEVGLDDVSASTTSSLAAHDLYLKGRTQLLVATKESLDSAELFFRQAIDLDPEYAAAWVGLGQLFTVTADAFASPAEVLPRARNAAERALTIEETPDARLLLAYVDMILDWEPRTASSNLNAILENSPNLPLGYLYLAHANLYQGPSGAEEAVRTAEKMIALEPLSPIGYLLRGFATLRANRLDDAIENEKRLRSIAPGFLYVESAGAVAFRTQKRFDEALQIYDGAQAAQPNEMFAGRAATLAMAGRRTEALAIVPLVEAQARSPYAPRAMVAAVHAALGNVDQMFEWLELGYHDYDAWLWYVPTLPEFAPYRDDPRMLDLMDRIGL